MAIVDRDDVVVSIDGKPHPNLYSTRSSLAYLSDWNKWKERLMAEAKEKCKRRRRDEE